MTMTRTKILWLVILFLLILNIVTVISAVRHSSGTEVSRVESIPVPLGQRVNFISDQLGLSKVQEDQFLEFTRLFNRDAGKITNRIEMIRFEMIDEMAEDAPDYEKLDEICDEIGDLHRQLKESTVSYYMDLKGICNEDQQKKLHGLFMTMADPRGDINTFVRGRGMHRGRQGRGGGAGWQNRYQYENINER